EADEEGLGGLSGSAIRADPAAYRGFLPKSVRAHYTRTVALHGIESTGKSTLAAALARELGTVWVPEYGRSHCLVHGTDCSPFDLETIAAAQQAMIDAAKPWGGALLITDTDWLMTRAWYRMMIGSAMAGPAYPVADLYLHFA